MIPLTKVNKKPRNPVFKLKLSKNYKLFFQTSTILCVCDTEMCNGGEMDTIIQRATENSLKTLTKPLIALPTIDQNQLLNNNQKPFKTNILKPIKKTFDS